MTGRPLQLLDLRRVRRCRPGRRPASITHRRHPHRRPPVSVSAAAVPTTPARDRYVEVAVTTRPSAAVTATARLDYGLSTQYATADSDGHATVTFSPTRTTERSWSACHAFPVLSRAPLTRGFGSQANRCLLPRETVMTLPVIVERDEWLVARVRALEVLGPPRPGSRRAAPSRPPARSSSTPSSARSRKLVPKRSSRDPPDPAGLAKAPLCMVLPLVTTAGQMPIGDRKLVAWRGRNGHPAGTGR